MARKTEGIKWTAESAQSEFGRDAATIQKRLKIANIEPDKSGFFSTAQICAAIYGDMEGAKLRKELALASQEERRDRKEARELIEATAVELVWEGYLTHVRQVIRHSELSATKKRELLDQLKEIPAEEYFKDNKVEEPNE